MYFPYSSTTDQLDQALGITSLVSPLLQQSSQVYPRLFPASRAKICRHNNYNYCLE